MKRRELSDVRFREDTEKGDVAKALQGLIDTHFKSKRFKDIMGATRLTRTEVMYMSLLEIERVRSKILSISEIDTQDDTLSDEEQQEIKEMYNLKKRFFRNPHALGFAILDSFEYMYGLGLQSLDGMSRREGVEITSGTVRRILEPEQMGRMERMKRRLFGDVLFPE